MSPFVRDYFCLAVECNAHVFQSLMRDLNENDTRFDARPDPERFTLREVIAHLTDYDAITRERFEHMIREENPDLPNWDHDDAARHYDSRDPHHGLQSLLLSRQELSAWLKGLNDREWNCRATRPQVGSFSVEEGVGLLLAHDSYHMKQIVDYLKELGEVEVNEQS